ncbi:serine protease [Streptomyces sp. UNOC14_S4]|uniref:serine protease n=1 Tax=Streptomyces sp. UNOC14_S4 TaxID=2872340 RepID=UPI001E3DE635|nr:serine protease [Streptomyces sp. UNOC14_S4]MCC3771324.1 NACHT domain-containing protein [Streptomyces sp. UNOC14_S4]
MHPVREHIAAVMGRGTQGSGYVLAPRLVLTAAHVAVEPVRAAVPGGVGLVECRVLWVRDDEQGDVALLLAERDLVGAETAASFEPVVWGRLRDLVWRDAQAIGFPQVARDAHEELDTEQLVGTLKPGSGLLGGRYVLDSAHGAPVAPADGGSPWAGMSGAAVFVGGLLCGVVCADPGGWRHGRLTVTPMFRVLSHPEFIDLCLEHGHRTTSRALPPSLEAEEQSFEWRLREYLAERAGELTIVGLTLSDGEGEGWPLDAAYLSLEVTGGDTAPRERWLSAPGRELLETAAPAPRRAEAALAGRARVLLRGAAGSGKTTLLQWLTSITAKDEIPVGLEQFRDCVPLLLPLRTLVGVDGGLPGPEEFLRAVARPLAGLPAARGRVTRWLSEGRALLLIDGVDEVPEADRRRTLEWLRELLIAYPDARYVVTTRPSAVREGWLADSGFTELELLPMSRTDVGAFIDRWHVAAGQEQSEELRAFGTALKKAVVAKPDLGRLATNPLMCALICALNRSRRGNLPRGRMELYRAALELLLVRRDRERDIPVGADGPELEHAQQTALLQKIAYWLIRNGRSEIEWGKAVQIIERALPAMPSVAARGDAESILRHLVLRSGLLRRPTSGTLDFIHRTFQDYLGAQAAVEEWDFDVLVDHAHDDQWEDVLRMAIGHASPKARAELLGMMLDRARCDVARGPRLRLLAAACLEHATELDPVVRNRVAEEARELVPPRDVEDAKALATAGRVVIDLLPGPDGISEGKYGLEQDEVARAVVVAATTVADDRAIPLLAEYADHYYLGVRAQLAWAWSRFDTDHYADEVIRKLVYDDAGKEDLEFVVQSKAEVLALKRLGGRPWVRCVGPLMTDDLRDLGTPVLETLSFRDNREGVDLRALRLARPLSELGILDSYCFGDLGALNGEELHTLNLSLLEGPGPLDAMSRMDKLQVLTLDWMLVTSSKQDLVLPRNLQYLRLGEGPSIDLQLAGMRRCRALRTLSYVSVGDPYEFTVLKSLPSLADLRIQRQDLTRWADAESLPQMERLFLDEAKGLAGLRHLPRVFPNLKQLYIFNNTHEPLDLAPLADMGIPDITIDHKGPLLNARLLPHAVHNSADTTTRGAKGRT